MSSFLPPRARTAPSWWSARWVLALLAVLALLTLGRLPLVDEDEGEYAEVAAELAHSSDWRAPTLNAQPFYEKPILLFWIQAPLLRVFGPQTWVFRLPSLLASVAWGALMLSWWSRRRSPRAGLLAAWLAATSAGMVVVGRAATMDALLILLLALTLFDLWDWLDQDHPARLRRAACWAGLGVLAKGPVALVIPGLVVGSFLLATPAARRHWRGLLDPWAWAILLALVLPWYAWYGVHSDGEFLRYFLWRENAGRLGGSLQGHGGSPLYYLLVLPLLLLPHGGVLVAVARQCRRLWAGTLERFLLLWFLCVFALFSLAGTKLPHYLLYGCTPLFLLGGACLAEARSGDRLRTAAGVAGLLLLPLLALALPLIAARVAEQTANPYLHEMLSEGAPVFDTAYWVRAGSWLAAALLAVVWLWRGGAPVRSVAVADPGARVIALAARAPLDPRALVMVPGLLTAAGISLVLLPALTDLQQRPVQAAARFAAGLGAPVLSDDRMPSFSVYLGHPTERRELRAGDVAFGRLDHPERLGRRHQVLFAQGGLRVVRVLEP